MATAVNIKIPDGAPPWVASLVHSIKEQVEAAIRAPTVTMLTMQPRLTAVMTFRTTAIDKSGALTGTLLNSPAAGNPTKWVTFDDAGTTRAFPTWVVP